MNYLSEKEINNYMQYNSKYFESTDISLFKNIIANSNLTLEELNTFKFKSPSLGRLLSVLFGLLGIDRFYSGNYILGLLKLCTFGGSGIWWIIDWFLIEKAIKQDNQYKFNSFLTGIKTSSWEQTVENIKNVLKSKKARQAIIEFIKSTKDFIHSFTDMV